MSAPVTRINAFRAAVVTTVQAAMPDLRECEEQFGRFVLEELERNIIKCPAVRFAVLRSKLKPEPSAEPTAELECAAFIVTEGKDRDAAGWAIAEAVAVLLHSAQLFGLVKLSPPSNVQILPVISGKLKARAVSVIAVEWRQELRELGAGIWDDEQHLLSELYVNTDLVDLTEGSV